MTTQLLIIFLLTILINTIDTSAYAARMAGVRTGHPALAGSLYHVLTLGSRGANALAGPLLASLTDLAVLDQNTGSLLNVYRIVVLAASVGTLIAALGIPSLSRILARGIVSYENRRSLPQVVVRGASVQGLWRMAADLTPPRLSAVRESRRSPFPKRFLIASILVTAIAAVSNAAAMYASALIPERVLSLSLQGDRQIPVYRQETLCARGFGNPLRAKNSSIARMIKPCLITP